MSALFMLLFWIFLSAVCVGILWQIFFSVCRTSRDQRLGHTMTELNEWHPEDPCVLGEHSAGIDCSTKEYDELSTGASKS